MSSARDHWILEKLTAYARGWWPIRWGTGPEALTGQGPRETVVCSQRHPRILPNGMVRLVAPLATHAAGYSYITGKRGRLSRRHFYLCDPCAERFRRRYGDRQPPAEERGGWTGGLSQPATAFPLPAPESPYTEGP